MISVCLVVLVVFLFLREIWATIIPSIAVPLSLVGTFGVMWLLGYTIDNLSLMALTIATGFVVDDAIVVIENITRYLEKCQESSYDSCKSDYVDTCTTQCNETGRRALLQWRLRRRRRQPGRLRHGRERHPHDAGDHLTHRPGQRDLLGRHRARRPDDDHLCAAPRRPHRAARSLAISALVMLLAAGARRRLRA